MYHYTYSALIEGKVHILNIKCHSFLWIFESQNMLNFIHANYF